MKEANVIIKLQKFLNKKAELLVNFRDRVMFSLGLFIYTILFVVLFIPFNISEWIVYTSPIKNFQLLGLSVFCSIIIFISQTIQYFLLRKKVILNYHLLLGFLTDIFFLSLPLSILYSDSYNGFFVEFYETVKVVLPTVFLGYVLGFLLLLVYKAQHRKVQEIPLRHIPDLANQRINISDANGQLKLSLRPIDILFIEAADNYIIVFFKTDEGIKKEIVRNAIKNLEAELVEFGFIRCHRSFLVNLQNVLSLKKVGRSYVINFGGVSSIIPVSRNYVSIVKESLQPPTT